MKKIRSKVRRKLVKNGYLMIQVMLKPIIMSV